VHWHLARVRTALAEQTQEASDWAQAAALYQQAVVYQHQTSCWLEYAHTLLQVSCCTGLKPPVIHAAEALKTAAQNDPAGFDSWELLQRIVERWSVITRGREPFSWAFDLLRYLANRQKKSFRLRLAWGQLLLTAGRMADQRVGDEALADQVGLWREALDKLAIAEKLGAPESLLVAPWAQTAALYGLVTDRLKWLNAATSRVARAVERDGLSSTLQLTQGLVQLARAQFFLDGDQFQKASDLLRTVAEEGNQAQVWYWLATCLLQQADVGRDDLLSRDLVARDAADCAYRAIACDRHHASYWSLAGEALLHCGEVDHDVALLQRATAAFAQAVELWGVERAPPQLLYHYGTTLDLLGECSHEASHDDQAIDLLRLALRRERSAIPTILALSAVLHRVGDERSNPQLLYEALLYLLEAMRDEPDEGAIWGQAGATCLTLWRLQRGESNATPGELLLERAHGYLMQAAQLGASQAHLYLAGLYALTGQDALAIASLDRAARYGALPPLEELLRDDWFAPLRSSLLFRDWFERCLRDEEEEIKG